MENDTQLNEYLQRIEVPHRSCGPTEDYLIELHIANMTHIPFETFDLIDFKQLNISFDYVFEHLIRQRRGGVCYQLNGLFSELLKQLNYDVKLVPCSVYHQDLKIYLDDKSHAAVLVTLNNDVKLLCDVGFSRNFLTPLIFRTDCVQYAINGYFRLVKTEDNLKYRLERGYLIDESDNISLPSSTLPRTHIIDIDPERFKWASSYTFPVDFLTKNIQLSDFEATCPYIVHAPEVPLNSCTICMIQTVTPSLTIHAIIGKEYWSYTFANGKETREHRAILTDDRNELEHLLKSTFGLSITDRKVELVEPSSKAESFFAEI